VIEIRLESWSELWPDCDPLMRAHWKEVRENRAGWEFDVDWKAAQRLEDVGLMSCVGARAEGKLVGYLIWFVTPSLESAGRDIATLGPFFVLPEWKGVGLKLWKRGLALLEKAGAEVAHVHVSAFGPRQEETRRFFELQGAKPYETKMEILLGDRDV
jgi:hypothetical protein